MHGQSLWISKQVDILQILFNVQLFIVDALKKA